MDRTPAHDDDTPAHRDDVPDAADATPGTPAAEAARPAGPADDPFPTVTPEVLDLSRDPRALRVLAHPARLALLTRLRHHGPATVRQLARHFDLDSGAASYHLRRLAAGGLIEEDPGRGTRRERWWRARHTGTQHDPAHSATDPARATGDDVRSGPDSGDDADRAYSQAVALAQSELLRRVAIETLPALPDAWYRATAFTDHRLWLTPDQTRAMRAELAEVIARYRAEGEARREDGTDGDTAGPVAAHLQVYGTPEPG
ncbi:ArsR/SmtB family transcription factor [Streptomyces sp. JNUCC 64]